MTTTTYTLQAGGWRGRDYTRASIALSGAEAFAAMLDAIADGADWVQIAAEPGGQVLGRLDVPADIEAVTTWAAAEIGLPVY